MANEAVPVEGPYEVHDFTVSAGTLISGMTLMKLSEPRTAAASANKDVFAGIAATEKPINVKTELGLYTKGIFKLTAAAVTATIQAGELVCLSGANLIYRAVANDIISGAIVGKAMEEIAQGSSGEVFVGGY